MQRREFLASSALSVAGAATLLAADPVGKVAASERVRVGCVGTGGRAFSLVNAFSRNKNCEVVALADLDPGKFGQAVAAVEKNQGTKPQTVADFRKLIDDKSLDAIVVGTPDHWHAIPTILACLAGKDVYVEKPDGHNIVEGQRMVAAMKKQGRVVQMGTQARTTERMQTAIEFIRTGALGRCLVARAWESAKQGSIGFPRIANHRRVSTMTCGSARPRNGRSIRTAFTAAGAGSTITARATSATTACIDSTWRVGR